MLDYIFGSLAFFCGHDEGSYSLYNICTNKFWKWGILVMVRKLNEEIIAQLAGVPIEERMAKGDWYKYTKEPKAQAIVKASAKTIQKINDLGKDDFDAADKALRDFLPNIAPDAQVYFPIVAIEYPANVTIGKGTFINANLQILSAGKVTFGKYDFIGPNCQLFTPNHPLDRQYRRDGWQYDSSITIGDDVWFGGSVIVLPGVTIGDNVVVGAGSVVTKDVPSNVLVAGNPARVIHELDATELKH